MAKPLVFRNLVVEGGFYALDNGSWVMFLDIGLAKLLVVFWHTFLIGIMRTAKEPLNRGLHTLIVNRIAL